MICRFRAYILTIICFGGTMRKLLALILLFFCSSSGSEPLSHTPAVSVCRPAAPRKIPRLRRRAPNPPDGHPVPERSQRHPHGASTGTILYDKESSMDAGPRQRHQVMSMLLIFEALSSGNIHLTDEVTSREHAAGMGGSQVFLEPGEIQTVETLISASALPAPTTPLWPWRSMSAEARRPSSRR